MGRDTTNLILHYWGGNTEFMLTRDFLIISVGTDIVIFLQDAFVRPTNRLLCIGCDLESARGYQNLSDSRDFNRHLGKKREMGMTRLELCYLAQSDIIRRNLFSD